MRMRREKKFYGYSHISRDQAAQVQHLWEFTRIYMEQRRIDGKSTKLLRRMTDALVLRDTYWHEWNRLLFMNDIEIVQLNWFQQDFYQVGSPTAIQSIFYIHHLLVLVLSQKQNYFLSTATNVIVLFLLFPLQDYFRYLDSLGGFWLYRWGDHGIRTL